MPYAPRMQVFFRSRVEIERFLRELHLVSCPVCGVTGSFVRHGYVWGYVTPGKWGIRRWRIYCTPTRDGCAKAPSVCLAATLLRRYFTTAQLWAFIRELMRASSIKAAWERCEFRLPLDMAYRLVNRIRICQPILRTHPYSRSPPPEEECAGSTLQQVFTHLRSAFGDDAVVSTYQQKLQKDFLAIA